MEFAPVAFRIPEQVAHDRERIGQIVPFFRFNRNVVVGQRDAGSVVFERFHVFIQQDAVEPREVNLICRRLAVGELQVVDQFVHIAGVLGRNGIADAGFQIQRMHQRDFLFLEPFVKCRCKLGKSGFAAGRSDSVQEGEHFSDFRYDLL